MLLAVDIGNSSIKFGQVDGETLTSKFSIPTQRDATAETIKAAVGHRLSSHPAKSVVCSVVPELDEAMRRFLRDAIGLEPVFANNSFDFGLKINYEPLDSLGTDRLVAAFGAVEKYGPPCIVCSLGTATTIDVVSADREFLGGVIAPGMSAMAAALYLKTSKLTQVEISKPPELLGNSTRDSIKSGVYNGYLAMVQGLVSRFEETVGDDAKTIATGGLSELVTAECDLFDIVDPDLILHGLARLSFNRKRLE